MKLTPLTLSIVTTTLISGVAIALAWTGPTGSPFSNNTAAPVNVGTVSQIKAGGFSSNGIISLGGFKAELSSVFGSLGTNRGYVVDVVGGIGADNIYSYGNVCTNNTLGGCNGTGGVVIGGANTSALVNITNTGNSFFNVGNVGIGTNSPAAKLDVVGQIVGGFGAVTTAGIQDWNDISNSRSGSGYSLLNGSDTNGPSASGNYFHPFNFEYNSKTGGGNTTQLAIPYGNQASVDEGLYMRGRFGGTWSSWRKVISEGVSGNVGIGTTAPTQKLTVNGTIFSSAGGFRFPDNTVQTTAATGQWTTSGANIFNANTGNVGIGTGASPVSKLDVLGAINIQNNNNLTWGGAYGAGIPTIAATVGTGINFYPTGSTSGANAILNANGLGLGGSQSTGAKLHVFGDSTFQGTAGTSYFSSGAANYIRGNTYFNGALVDEDNGAYYLNPAATSVFNGAAFNDISWGLAGTRTETRNDAGTSGGKSGFYEALSPTNYYAGASSWQHLIESRHNNTSNNYALQIAGSFFDQELYFRKTGNSATTGWSKVVAANSSGNVGIGTASPTQRLDVAGTIRSSSGGFQFPDNTIQTTAAPGAPYRIWQNWSSPVYGVGIGADNVGGWERRYGFMNSAGTTYLGGFGGGGASDALSELWIGASGANASIKVTPSNKQVTTDTAAGQTFFGYNGTSVNYLRGATTYFNGSLVDENNSAYYIDPASTSVLSTLNVSGNLTVGGLAYINNTYGSVSLGAQNSSYAHITTDRPAFYMGSPLSVNGNIGTYNGTITLESSTGNTRYNTVRSGAVGSYDAANTQQVFAMGDAYKLTPGGSSANYGNFYGIGWSYNPDYGGAGNNPQSKPGLNHQALFMQAGTTRTAIGNGIWSDGVIHSNTGGFRFPDGTTQTTASTGLTGAVRTDVAGDWQIANGGAFSQYQSAAFEIREANFAGAQTGVAAEAPRISFHWAGRVASQIGMDASGVIRTYNNPGTGYEAFAAAGITANGSITSTANINATGGTVTAAAISTVLGSHLSYSGTNVNYLRGNTYSNGVYYDENNAAYYVDPASTSITNDLRANILYDQGNTGYYLDPASSSNLNGVATQNITVASGIVNSEWYRSSGNGGWYSNTHGGGIYMDDSTWIRTYGSKAFYHNAGAFRTDGTLQVGGSGATLSVPNGGNTAVGYGLTVATTGTFGGNVTAPAFIYSSDERLKDNIAPIESSLDKVRALKGYTFNWKKDSRADVGLVAQQVETVFPELVHTDAVTGLKAVEYGNLVAPLIEAVKELANTIDSLATRVFNTETRQTELEKQNEIQAQQIADLQRQINLLQAK